MVQITVQNYVLNLLRIRGTNFQGPCFTSVGGDATKRVFLSSIAKSFSFRDLLSSAQEWRWTRLTWSGGGVNGCRRAQSTLRATRRHALALWHCPALSRPPKTPLNPLAICSHVPARRRSCSGDRAADPRRGCRSRAHVGARPGAETQELRRR